MAEQIARASHGARVIATERGDKAYVDLRAAVRAQLAAAGVSDARIEDVPGCTKHEAARFHSFRRDGADSGRMLAAIATRAGRRERMALMMKGALSDISKAVGNTPIVR